MSLRVAFQLTRKACMHGLYRQPSRRPNCPDGTVLTALQHKSRMWTKVHAEVSCIKRSLCAD